MIRSIVFFPLRLIAYRSLCLYSIRMPGLFKACLSLMETQKMADPLLNIELEMTMYQEVEQKILFLPTMLSSRFDLTPTVKKCI